MVGGFQEISQSSGKEGVSASESHCLLRGYPLEAYMDEMVEWSLAGSACCANMGTQT